MPNDAIDKAVEHLAARQAELLKRTGELAKYLSDGAYSLSDCAAAITMNAFAKGEYTLEFLEKCVQAADERHCYGSDNEIETDGCNILSIGDTGIWVNGWLWVPNEDVGLPGEDDDEEEEEEEDVEGILEAIEKFNEDPMGNCPRSDGSKIVI